MSEQNTYDQCADQYAAWRAGAERAEAPDALVLQRLLECVGDVSGQTVLDAGCGEGLVSRILAGRGAKVTAIDVSARLVDIARSRRGAEAIDYHVRDLSRPLAAYQAHFDLAVAHQVLSDVPDYRGFIATLAAVTRPGRRAVLSVNNPYSAVIREKVESYFDNGASVMYEGLAAHGIEVRYYHRTLEDYVTAFRDDGFVLNSLYDVPSCGRLPAGEMGQQAVRRQFPFFMVLEFLRV